MTVLRKRQQRFKVDAQGRWEFVGYGPAYTPEQPPETLDERVERALEGVLHDETREARLARSFLKF